MDHQFAADIGPDHEVDVLLFERDGATWRLVGASGFQTVTLPPLPARLPDSWTPVNWVEQVEGWFDEGFEGEIVLTDEQRALISATYGRLVAEGKLTHTTTAGMSNQELGWKRLDTKNGSCHDGPAADLRT